MRGARSLSYRTFGLLQSRPNSENASDETLHTEQQENITRVHHHVYKKLYIFTGHKYWSQTYLNIKLPLKNAIKLMQNLAMMMGKSEITNTDSLVVHLFLQCQ